MATRGTNVASPLITVDPPPPPLVRVSGCRAEETIPRFLEGIENQARSFETLTTLVFRRPVARYFCEKRDRRTTAGPLNRDGNARAKYNSPRIFSRTTSRGRPGTVSGNDKTRSEGERGRRPTAMLLLSRSTRV